jgi:hypothetical protein
MSQDHTLMASRYELKYLIPESIAQRVSEFIQQYLELDEFAIGQRNSSYAVHSLYLDSDDWTIYHRTLNGDRNRYKLRIRYYTEDPAVPVFCEIKRREKDVIHKHRCAVRRTAVPDILSGLEPRPEGLFNPKPQDLEALREFMRLGQTLGTGPKLHIFYQREAYVNDFNNEVRVTLDRDVRAGPRFDGLLPTICERPYECSPEGLVILELKFTSRFPGWYRDLVETFSLAQTGAAKYVEGANLHLGLGQNPRDIPRGLWL